MSACFRLRRARYNQVQHGGSKRVRLQPRSISTSSGASSRGRAWSSNGSTAPGTWRMARRGRIALRLATRSAATHTLRRMLLVVQLVINQPPVIIQPLVFGILGMLVMYVLMVSSVEECQDAQIPRQLIARSSTPLPKARQSPPVTSNGRMHPTYNLPKSCCNNHLRRGRRLRSTVLDQSSNLLPVSMLAVNK